MAPNSLIKTAEQFPQINKEYFGWFSEPSGPPEHDPGMEANCVICNQKLERGNVTTVSFMVPSDARSYFYRAHKTCYDLTSDSDISDIEGSIIDQIVLNNIS